MDAVTRPYVCGQCTRCMDVKLRETVKCVHCGYRVVYKPRAREIHTPVRYVAI